MLLQAARELAALLDQPLYELGQKACNTKPGSFNIYRMGAIVVIYPEYWPNLAYLFLRGGV